MRPLALLHALPITLLLALPSLAGDQPLTRAGCEAAGMTWDESGNVCGGETTAPAATLAQPLTRAACEGAGQAWNEASNVCGAFNAPSTVAAVETPGQPLTRSACDAAGQAWKEDRNVCGVASPPAVAKAVSTAAPLPKSARKAQLAERKSAKAANKSPSKHVAKKHYRKKGQAEAQATERRPFRLFPNWKRRQPDQ